MTGLSWLNRTNERFHSVNLTMRGHHMGMGLGAPGKYKLANPTFHFPVNIIA